MVNAFNGSFVLPSVLIRAALTVTRLKGTENMEELTCWPYLIEQGEKLLPLRLQCTPRRLHAVSIQYHTYDTSFQHISDDLSVFFLSLCLPFGIYLCFGFTLCASSLKKGQAGIWPDSLPTDDRVIMDAFMLFCFLLTVPTVTQTSAPRCCTHAAAGPS